jgi:F-type H+-transporting ATPase subunit b
MLIDWFTVGAQALNFLILVWLMRHFLYQPVLNAIAAREKRIAAELAGADAKRAEAQKEHDEFDGKNQAFDAQRAALLGQAEAAATSERDRLMAEARKDADTLRANQQTALRNDQARLGQEFTRLAADEVFGIARKTLADLATVSLEERIAEVFTRRLHEMDAKGKAALTAAVRASTDPALVRSTFALPPDQQAAIQNALNETCSAAVRVRFETAPAGLSGIEVTANGEKLAWSIADYLAVLEKKVGALVEARAGAPAAAK